AGDGLSHRLRDRRRLRSCAPCARSAYAARVGAWPYRPCIEHCGLPGNVGVWARLVFARDHRQRDSLRMGGWQNPQPATGPARLNRHIRSFKIGAVPQQTNAGRTAPRRERKVMAALIRLVAAIVLCAATGWGALAQSDADFFRNKTAKFMITFEPGGSYDLYARLAATYLPKHIPGQPAMAVQYHPGAGGLIGILHFAEKA